MTTPIPFTPDPTAKPEVTGFFDADTNTISYLVRDPASDACAVIDSVMDIDYAAGRITHQGADRIVAEIRDRGLKLEWIIETHVHADHLSAAPYIQEMLGGKLGIGAEHHACRIRSARSSTRVPSSSATARNSTGCSRTATVIGSARIDGACAAYARPHAGLHDACRRRRRLHRRHAVHARRRLGACRFPRRRRAHPLPLDPPGVVPAGRHPAVHLPRLRATAAPSASRPPSPRSGRTTSMSRTASARMSSWPCARRATRRWRCPS